MSELEALCRSLIADLEARESAVVAYSGGVDSSLVAALAFRALGARSLAVTAAAETLAGAELESARRGAVEIGIEHEIVTYSELSNPNFVANPRHRCYVCQGMRMDLMRQVARARSYAIVCDGTNASDPGPNRPGLEAIRERGVYSPLLANGVDKSTTRLLAHHLGLTAWNRPANACLSSRIPHGQPVTLGKLRRIEKAEDLLQEHGFRVVRVRHEGTTARVEVGQEEIARLESLWCDLGPRVKEFGFENAVIDAAGYRAGGADRGPVPS